MERGDNRASEYILDAQGKRNPNRDCFLTLKKYLHDYTQKKGKDPLRFFVLYGLRGTGKTTLLSQLYGEIYHMKYRLLLSVDEVVKVMGVALKDVLDVYEEVLGFPFGSLPQPVFLFLDEVHFDDEWAILLKTIYDRTKNIFFIVTGSSALALQSTPDIARRALFEKIHPMQFTEYIKIRHGVHEKEGLSQKLRDIVFNSSSATEVYDALQDIESEMREYWSDLEKKDINDIDTYLGYGTFPFTVVSPGEMSAYEQISEILDKVVNIDIPHIEEFSTDTISKIPELLYTLAASDQCDTVNLSKSTGISRPTLSSILKTLEKTEIVWRVRPHGQPHKQVRKPSKYLFTSPAFRSMYFNLIESVPNQGVLKGRMLEDAVGLSLRRLFSERPGFSVTYDSSKGGADFIVRRGEKIFIIEVGYGHKNMGQVIQTMGKIQQYSYGIIISENPLNIDHDNNIVWVPIRYFLLI